MKQYLIILFLLAGLSATAQNAKYEITENDYDNYQVEMADVMRSNGKIYVVVGVMVIIFAGLIFYTAYIDRKLTRIERKVFEENVNS